VLIWFAVASVLLVALVFKSPGVDYRWVVAGAVLPLAEAVLGGPRVLHAVVGPAVLLGMVVLATRRRRQLRRRVHGLPIGMMAHLVLDGSFTRSDVFWWPFRGWSFAPGQVPELDHLGVSVVLELVGIALAWWAWGWFGLRDPERRARFAADGRLDVPGG
jgi:hypothetical protein